LPLDALAQEKKAGFQQQLDEAEEFQTTAFSKFILFFWSPESPYLVAKTDEGRPLSLEYVENWKRYAERFIEDYASFKKTQLRSIPLLQVESFIRHLRDSGENGNTVSYALRSLQAPLSWAAQRGLLDRP